MVRKRFCLFWGFIAAGMILAAPLRGYAADRRSELESAVSSSQAAPEEEQAAGGRAEPAFIEMEDGEYAISVELTGGTGRSTVDSPAGLIVKDGLAWARLRWSSSSYDYMVVGGEKYLPVNTEGYSTFEVPILAFDAPVKVIADTTAMSVPHEVEYTLLFRGDSVMSAGETPQAQARKVVYMALAIAVVCAAASLIRRSRMRSVRRGR